jgi:hypothetical protein
MFIAAQTSATNKTDGDATKTEKIAAAEGGALSDKEMRAQALLGARKAVVRNAFSPAWGVRLPDYGWV